MSYQQIKLTLSRLNYIYQNQLPCKPSNKIKKLSFEKSLSEYKSDNNYKNYNKGTNSKNDHENSLTNPMDILNSNIIIHSMKFISISKYFTSELDFNLDKPFPYKDYYTKVIVSLVIEDTDSQFLKDSHFISLLKFLVTTCPQFINNDCRNNLINEINHSPVNTEDSIVKQEEILIPFNERIIIPRNYLLLWRDLIHFEDIDRLIKRNLSISINIESKNGYVDNKLDVPVGEEYIEDLRDKLADEMNYSLDLLDEKSDSFDLLNEISGLLELSHEINRPLKMPKKISILKRIDEVCHLFITVKICNFNENNKRSIF